MTRAYNRSSVALFTLVIPEQDFADGVVIVASAEGHISRVTISGDAKGGPAPLIARMAAPLPGQAPLPRARFERALGTIADIPGTKVTPTLALGDSPGAVALDLAVDASRPTLGVGFTTRSSPYVRDGITKWVHGWQRNGWKTAAKKPVANADLWQRLVREAARHEIEWLWVKGHAGHGDNELADKLASDAALAIKR
jgi:hypothetical protein